MRPYLARLAILIAAAALAACSGQGTVPSQSGSASTMMAQSGSQPVLGSSLQALGPIEAQAMPMEAAKDPCDIKGMWYFKGACTQISLKAAGSTISLKAYKGITMTEGLAKNNASGTVKFISGNGTGKTDITGTLSGTAFPLYGSLCFDSSGKQTPCTGKVLVYFDLLNASKSEIIFPSTPLINVTDTGKSPGKTCQFDVLASTQSGQFGYELLPITGKVTKGKFSLKAAKVTLTLPSSEFFVFAISCK